MGNEIKIGKKVVAKGKLAIIKGVLNKESIRVIQVSTGSKEIVSIKDIEFIDSDDIFDCAPEEQGLPALSEVTPEDLELAARRYEIIKRWKRDEINLAQAVEQLSLSKSHFYRMARSYDEEQGSLSMLRTKRGRKQGATRLSEQVEKIILKSIKHVYKSRAATYSKVWKEVHVTCVEQGLETPCRESVSRRVRFILSEAERDKIKLGSDEASQRHSPRPGKKKLTHPLELVQMDHTLVDVLLLDNDRRNIIGRPWLTIVIDVNTRIILGYYLSLYVPSAVSVASALSNAILPKDDFCQTLGIASEDYPFFGLPSVIHMDNAAEFTSAKIKLGCSAFGIDPKYRPISKKHYGGHVERLIGTFMTSEVHFLKGTTMSNAVARRGLDSEKEATMTFSDFSRWFAREVVVYHCTVHEGLKISPREAWLNHFSPVGGAPFPMQVSDSNQLRLFFMPEKTRCIHPYGVELSGNIYWDPILSSYIGTKKAVVKFDPYNMNAIWLKIDGEFYPIRLSDLTMGVSSYEEYRAGLINRRPISPGAITHDGGIKAYREKQEIERESERLTKAERRNKVAAEVYSDAHANTSESSKYRESAVAKPDYSKPPQKFKPEG